MVEIGEDIPQAERSQEFTMQPRKVLLLMAALTASASLMADEAAPPPPPPPGAPVSVDGLPPPNEIRRIVIRGVDQDPVQALRMHRGMHNEGGARKAMQNWDRMMDELDLTPQQRGKITEHRATYQPEMRKLRQELQQARRALRDTNPGDAKYSSKVAETTKRVGELSAKMVTQSAELRSKVWSVLTPEQQKKMLERQQMMRERMGKAREVRIERRVEGGERPAIWIERKRD
jgi:Spy/CpxP family protein refolding chaperone